MSAGSFIERQLVQIQQGGRLVLLRKMKRVLQILVKLPLCILAVPVVFVLRLIRSWLLVRWADLHSSRIGHFAANTELYLCEQDGGINVPKQRHVDFFYMGYRPICNQQLAVMWKRVLRVWPSWILAPISLVNRLIPGGAVHEIGNNSQHDRDVHNLLDRFPPHLEFTPEEEARGEAGMRAMGIPERTRFVCFHAREPEYLRTIYPHHDYSYHDYRDSSINNYLLAADLLTRRGYYAIRMGSVVKEALRTTHPSIIDYAGNGCRSDFLDIFLGAKCDFFISSSTGIDAIPMIFRRPVMYVNNVPLEYATTWLADHLFIPKKHWLRAEHRFLTFREILDSGVGRFLHSEQYATRGIELIENTPEEIADLAIEMDERLKGTWRATEEDEDLQRRFWAIYRPSELHGKFVSRIGTEFLRQNGELLG